MRRRGSWLVCQGRSCRIRQLRAMAVARQKVSRLQETSARFYWETLRLARIDRLQGGYSEIVKLGPPIAKAKLWPSNPP